MIKAFVLHWLDGKVEIVHGLSINEAFSHAGYSHGALKALDYYKELKTEHEKMFAKLESSSPQDLQTIWKALDIGWEKDEQYAPGISMDDWVQNVYIEMSVRGIPRDQQSILVKKVLEDC